MPADDDTGCVPRYHRGRPAMTSTTTTTTAATAARPITIGRLRCGHQVVAASPSPRPAPSSDRRAAPGSPEPAAVWSGIGASGPAGATGGGRRFDRRGRGGCRLEEEARARLRPPAPVPVPVLGSGVDGARHHGVVSAGFAGSGDLGRDGSGCAGTSAAILDACRRLGGRLDDGRRDRRSLPPRAIAPQRARAPAGAGGSATMGGGGERATNGGGSLRRSSSSSTSGGVMARAKSARGRCAAAGRPTGARPPPGSRGSGSPSSGRNPSTGGGSATGSPQPTSSISARHRPPPTCGNAASVFSAVGHAGQSCDMRRADPRHRRGPARGGWAVRRAHGKGGSRTGHRCTNLRGLSARICQNAHR